VLDRSMYRQYSELLVVVRAVVLSVWTWWTQYMYRCTHV